jgi:C4-type Zn-finger protein
MEKQECPHCRKELKLISESHKITDKGATRSKKYRCPVQGCGYTYTESISIDNE